MERKIGTVSRGVRCPIIRKGDDLAKIVTDSIIDAGESENIEFRDRDIVSVTESVVARAQGNYASVDDIAKDVERKFGKDSVVSGKRQINDRLAHRPQMVCGWLDALPPAFTRGVPPVRTLVAGGVRIPGCRALNRIIFLYLPSLFLVLFSERYVGDELPPLPVCATITTPLTSAGGKAACRIETRTVQRQQRGNRPFF